MMSCTRYCAAESQFDQKVAERDLRRYSQRGPEPMARIMLAELRGQPSQKKRLLDIGGGIGLVSAELAGAGIADVTYVEASPAYLEWKSREASSNLVTLHVLSNSFSVTSP
jgi:2-polyprenyl-3-methyl-5-hydroxy-6-metoxy-1,4-benzoquinol methylase